MPVNRIVLFFLTVLLSVALPDAPANAGDDAVTMRVVVFDDNGPVRGVELALDQTPVGTTDQDGVLETSQSAGNRTLTLIRDGRTVGETTLSVGSGAAVQVIATLSDGGETSFDVEGAESGGVSLAASTVTAAVVKFAGRIISAESREPVAGAQIYVSGVATRLTSADDGSFTATLPAGAYQVSVVHPNFSTQTLDEVALSTESGPLDI
jgi:hypothetical protein